MPDDLFEKLRAVEKTALPENVHALADEHGARITPECLQPNELELYHTYSTFPAERKTHVDSCDLCKIICTVYDDF